MNPVPMPITAIASTTAVAIFSFVRSMIVTTLSVNPKEDSSVWGCPLVRAT